MPPMSVVFVNLKPYRTYSDAASSFSPFSGHPLLGKAVWLCWCFFSCRTTSFSWRAWPSQLGVGGSYYSSGVILQFRGTSYPLCPAGECSKPPVNSLKFHLCFFLSHFGADSKFHLHAKRKYCPAFACEQTLERFRENICDHTLLPQIKISCRCGFFPSPFLPNFATHNEYSGWLCINQAMRRNSFIFPFYTLPFHPSAIQPLPLSEQISQFNFIVAHGLKIVSCLWNDCDNQIARAHIYLTWQVEA